MVTQTVPLLAHVGHMHFLLFLLFLQSSEHLPSYTNNSEQSFKHNDVQYISIDIFVCSCIHSCWETNWCIKTRLFCVELSLATT